MNTDDLHKKYLGEKRPSHVYHEANVVTRPLTEWEVINFKKDGFENAESFTATGLPNPNNFDEAWEQFSKFWAQMAFENYVMGFLDSNKNVRRESLQFELNKINEWIEKVNTTIASSKACARPNSILTPKPDFHNWEEEYIRLANGYYEIWHEELIKGRCAANVYGKYFMYKCWLEQQLQIVESQSKITFEQFRANFSENENVEWQLVPMGKNHLFLRFINKRTGYSWQNEVPELAPYEIYGVIQLYSEWFEKHAKKVIPEFERINASIKPFLENNYENSPDVEEFTFWFLSTHYDKAKINYEIQVEPVNQIVRLSKLKFQFSDFDTVFTPAVIMRDLQEFCNLKQQELRGIKASLQLNPKSQKGKTTQVQQAYTLEDMFQYPAHAEVCLNILKELPNPVLDGSNSYIGKNKGIFPAWIKVLQQHKPSLVKSLSDIEFKDILNAAIPNLNLSKDASEFRTTYSRIENSGVELDMKTKLSQLSQSGKLGK